MPKSRHRRRTEKGVVGFKAEAREREFRDQNVEVAELPNEEQFEFPREDDVTIETQLSRRALLAGHFLETKISEDDRYLLQLSANFFDFVRNEPAIDPDLRGRVSEDAANSFGPPQPQKKDVCAAAAIHRKPRNEC